MINSVIRFFDLYSQYRPEHAVAHAGGNSQFAWWRQLLVYLGCVVGVLLGPYAVAAAGGESPSLEEIFGSITRLIWALVFAFVIIAALFKALLSPKLPLVAQIGTAIVTGFISEKIIPTVIETAAKSWPSGA